MTSQPSTWRKGGPYCDGVATFTTNTIFPSQDHINPDGLPEHNISKAIRAPNKTWQRARVVLDFGLLPNYRAPWIYIAQVGGWWMQFVVNAYASSPLRPVNQHAYRSMIGKVRSLPVHKYSNPIVPVTNLGK